jgi:transcriptional regulator with XRE-family HTH domain
MTTPAPVSREKLRRAYERADYAGCVTKRGAGRVWKRGLSDAEIDRVLLAMERRLAERHEGVLARLAAELGMSQSGLWQITHRQTRPSYGTAVTLAERMGVPVESVLTSARERAANLCREAKISETAIQKILAEPLRGAPAEDVVLYWINRIQAVATLG